MSLKDNLTHQPDKVTNETSLPSLAELTHVYKELQENKLLIKYLVDQNKTLKKELQALNKNAGQTKQNQQHLPASVSHEIRTPLHAIAGLSNSLKDINDESERKESIEIIENAAFVLGAMISNILDTAKIDAHDLKLNIHPFNLKTLIKNLQTTFTYRLKNKPVEFKIEIDENIPDLVEGDEQKILHVLFNLLSNAERYTEKGMIQLSVAVLKSLHDKILMVFTIEDTGRGLSSDDSRLSYERLEDYIEKRKKLNEQGQGLGLPITNTLIKLLNGDIKIASDDKPDSMEGSVTLESNANNGVKITAVLPLKRYGRKNEKEKIVSAEDDTLLSTLNTLVAEDSNINRIYFSILLNKWNIPHTFVNNGNEAIEKINTDDFDVVLMDINMPELDGFKTTEAIRKMEDAKKRSVPVIGVSASVSTEYRIRGKKVGINYFLPKPFKPEQLKDLLIEFAMEKKTQNDPFSNNSMFSEYFGNDYFAAAEIFKVFIEESIPEINNWEELLQEKGARELGVRVHALKSVMEMLGLSSLSEKCFDLEQACAFGVDDNLLKEKIEYIKSRIKKAEPRIIEQYQFISKMAKRND
jgi:signal transduction histidine kinase/DNA-binding NarL/FixJ family response regulator